MMILQVSALLFSIVMGSTADAAEELHSLYRSAQIQAMGGVAAATAEGVDALFLNPAGLAANEKFSLQLTNAYVEGSTSALVNYPTYLTLFSSSLSISNFSTLLGKPVFAKAQVAPTVLSGNLGIGFIYDVEGYQYVANRSLPDTDMGAQITYGVQLGYGYKKRITRGNSKKQSHELRIGVGAKMLYRRGGYFKLDPIDYFSLTDYTTLLNQKTGGYALGLGVDLGAQYIIPIGRKLRLSSGLSITDIGDTVFGDRAASIRQNMSLGSALCYDTGGIRFTLAYDYRNITQGTDWKQRNHIGLELKMPMFTAFAGINQVYMTYGGSFDVWIMRVSGAVYSQELGVYTRSLADARYAVTADARIAF